MTSHEPTCSAAAAAVSVQQQCQPSAICLISLTNVCGPQCNMFICGHMSTWVLLFVCKVAFCQLLYNKRIRWWWWWWWWWVIGVKPLPEKQLQYKNNVRKSQTTSADRFYFTCIFSLTVLSNRYSSSLSLRCQHVYYNYGEWRRRSYIPDGDDEADGGSTEYIRCMVHIVSNSTETREQRGGAEQRLHDVLAQHWVVAVETSVNVKLHNTAQLQYNK